MKTSLGIWALGPMVTRFVPVGYQPEHGDESTRGEGAPRGGGARRPDGRLRVPLPARALARQPRRGARRARRPRHLLHRRGLHLDPRFGRGGLVSPDAAMRDEARRLTRDAADFAGSLGAHFIVWPGIEGYNYPFQTPYADSWRWLIEGIGEAAEVCAGHGVKLFLEHKNSEPAMKILMRNIGMTLHVIHKLRAEGDRQRAGEHGLAAPADERRAPAGVRGAAGRRGAARPPARQLRLGHLRRRQHGRRHRVHGDVELALELRRAGLRGRRRAARLRPLPVHRGPGGGGAPLGGAVALHRRRGRADRRRRPARGPAARRTRCAPTSSCTRRSARDRCRARHRDERGQGARARRGRLGARARRARATRSHTPRPGWAEQDPELWWDAASGGARRAERRRRARRASACPARCTGSCTLDSADRVLRPAILWNDQRTAAECAEIEERGGPRRADRADRQPGADRLHRAQAAVDAPPRAGGSTGGSRRCCCRRTTCGCACCGEKAIDVADASGTLLFDVARRRWSERRCWRRSSSTRRWLPPGARVAGGVRRDGGGVPVAAGRRATRPRARSGVGRGPARARRRWCSAPRAWCSPRSTCSPPTRRRACTPSATRCPAPGTRWA